MFQCYSLNSHTLFLPCLPLPQACSLCLRLHCCPANTFITTISLDSMFCCCLVTPSCLTLCDPMDCGTPRFPILHHLPELTQIHVHRVSDAIQPSHPLSSPSPPAFSLSQHQGLFQWVSSSHQVAKSIGASGSASVLPVNIQDWFPWGWTGLISLQSKGLSKVFSSTQFRIISSLVLSLLYGPALISVQDCWKNQTFDEAMLSHSVVSDSLQPHGL